MKDYVNNNKKKDKKNDENKQNKCSFDFDSEKLNYSTYSSKEDMR